MLNRLLQQKPHTRNAYVDAYGRISRTSSLVDANVDVNLDSLLSVPGIWRAVTLVSDIVGSLPLYAVRDDIPVDPTPRLLERPNPLETRPETLGAMTAALLVHGNYIAILGEPGANGYPDSIYPVNPERVKIMKKDGIKVFEIERETYSASEIFHVKGFSMPGEVAGIGIMAAQRQGIGSAIAILQFAARYFAGGGLPSYVIKSDNPDLQQDEAEALKWKWLQQYGGTNREPVVLNASTDIKQISSNAQESQLLEAQQQINVNASNIAGVPGNYVNAPNSSRTYNNLEAQALELLKTSVQAPILSRLEATFTDYLPRGQYARFNLDYFLRADTLTRYQAHQIALQNGFLTIDEVRELEKRPALNGGTE